MIIKSIIAIVVLSIASGVNAASMTYKTEHSKSRVFLNLIQENKYYQVSVFKQNKGEFQELIQQNSFKQLKEFYTWKKVNYPNLEEGSLSKWTIASSSKEFKRKSRVFWNVENSWSSEWEAKYAKWIESSVDSEFFYRHSIETDCADIVVGLRWIFARKYKLPAANRLASTGDLFTQDDVPRKWRKLSRHPDWYKDELFVRALNFLMNSTSSWSLEKDSYPVKLDRDGLIAGRYIINNKNDSWHTRIFSESDYGKNQNIPLYTWASTAPRDNRILIKEIYLDEGWPTDGALEILGHKWPIRTKKSWRLASYSEQPDYGPSQFEGGGLSSGGEFYKSLFKKIKPGHSITSLLEFSVNEIKNYIEQRIGIVSKGAEFCKNNNCSEGTLNWDNWSTPSRDSKLEGKFKKYELIFSKYQYESGTIHKKWLDGISNTFVYLEGLKLSLADILYIWNNNFYSSDPSASLEKRWGLNFIDHFNTYAENLKRLFTERDVRLSDTDCTNGCNSDSGQWWDYHTYHIDAEIFRYFSKYNKLCEHYGNSSECLDIKNDYFNKEIEQQGLKLSLFDWEKRIPLFNSDPRASLDEKLGLHVSLDSYLFNDLSTLLISKNNYALIDRGSVVDLISGEEVVKSSPDQTLFLHMTGQIFSLSNFNLKILGPTNSQEVYNFSGVVSSFQTTDAYIFYDRESVVSISMKDSKINVLELGDIKSIDIYDETFIIWTSKGGGAYDKSNLQKLTSLPSQYYGKLSKVILDDEFLIGQYIYKDADKYCSFIYTLKTEKFACLSPAKSLLEFYEKVTDTLAYSVDIEGEKKNIFISHISNYSLVNPIYLSNFIYHYELSSDVLHILTATGDYYDASESRTLFIYDPSAQTSLNLVEKGSVTYFYHDAYFGYSDDDLGVLELPSRSLRTPSRINLGYSSGSYTNSAENPLIWRYNSGKGDLYGIGGIVFNPLKFIDGSEIFPDISLRYNHLDLSEARQERLEEKVLEFEIYSGTISAIDENNFIWIR